MANGMDRTGIAVFFTCLLLFAAAQARAQDSFFKGKNMHIIVGGPPGGGFDTYARMIARTMPKHIPGNPTIIVDNMPGAGMIIAANHVYKVVRPDGLTIGHFTGSQTINQVLGQPGAINFGKNQAGNQLIDVVIHGGNIFERTFLLPPGVPKGRAELLKRAFAKTLEDPEFLADANKAKLGVAPVFGDELERRVNGFFKLPEDLKRKLKRGLYD
jgi:tripartite-type tricarboxylate transporter receptor subunit TctC